MSQEQLDTALRRKANRSLADLSDIVYVLKYPVPPHKTWLSDNPEDVVYITESKSGVLTVIKDDGEHRTRQVLFYTHTLIHARVFTSVESAQKYRSELHPRIQIVPVPAKIFFKAKLKGLI